jgi:hypothetical protein
MNKYTFEATVIAVGSGGVGTVWAYGENLEQAKVEAERKLAKAREVPISCIHIGKCIKVE